MYKACAAESNTSLIYVTLLSGMLLKGSGLKDREEDR